MNTIDYSFRNTTTTENLFRPTSNVSFNPLPSTSGKCSKLKINVILDSTHYVAGGSLRGRFEVISSTNQDLLLGDIAVELSGFEEIMESKLDSSQTFLSCKSVFQGDRRRPSDAVRGPSRGGYYVANKGKTVFYFAFDIPSDAPASFEFQSISRLVYQVTGYVRFKYGSTCDTLIKTKEARILDRWDVKKEFRLAQPITAMNERKLFMGGDGTVQLHSMIKSNFVTSGTNISIQVQVKNGTRKRVQGIKVAFIRRLLMLSPSLDPTEEATVKIIDEIVTSHSYKEKDFIYDQDEERTTMIHLPIPVTAYTVQKTSLSEIAWRVSVSLTIPGLLSKDLTVDLPLRICHPVSFEAPPMLPDRDSEKEKVSEKEPRLSRDMYHELDFGNRVIPLSQSIALPPSQSNDTLVEPKRTSIQVDPIVELEREVRGTVVRPSKYISAQDRYKNLQEQSMLLEAPDSPSQKPSSSFQILPFSLTNAKTERISTERCSRDKKSRDKRPPLPEIPVQPAEVSGLGYFFGKALDLIEYATSPVYTEKPQPPSIEPRISDIDVDRPTSNVIERDGTKAQETRTRQVQKSAEKKKKRRSKPLPQPKQPPSMEFLKKKLNLKSFLDGIGELT